MKRITAFIGSLGGGGAQGVFITVMNYYVSLGYEVNAVINTMENDVHSKELDRRIDLICLRANSVKESFPKILRYVRINDIELAFTFSPEITVNVIIARGLSGKRFQVVGRCINTLSYEYSHAAGVFRRQVTSRLVKMFYHKADMVVAQADRMRNDLIENYGFQPYQVTTINNPLSDKFSKEVESKANNDREGFVLYVGRFEKQKGLDMLLEAFAKSLHKETLLLMIGNGSLTEIVRQKAGILGLEDRVLILPFNNNVEEYYRSAQLTIMSSYFEGFPNVLSESIACGTPVVSFDLPSGPSDIIIPERNGYLARYLDVKDLAQKIDTALERKWNYDIVKETALRFRKDNILPLYKELLETLETI